MSSTFNSGDYSRERGEIVYIPTEEDVECLQVGDMMLDCFGRPAKVVEIFARGYDITHRPFICFYTEFGSNGGRVSGDIKAGELIRHSNLGMTSAELDKLQAEILADDGQGNVYFM